MGPIDWDGVRIVPWLRQLGATDDQVDEVLAAVTSTECPVAHLVSLRLPGPVLYEPGIRVHVEYGAQGLCRDFRVSDVVAPWRLPCGCDHTPPHPGLMLGL